ncbi:MAG: hypothetical protein IPG87_12845 [Saprospiraceae bacterium]|nr:hypothetical protein [Candidatus Vicinibacter affinis]
MDGNTPAWEENNSFHLLDLAKENTLSLFHKHLSRNKTTKPLYFNLLGIDKVRPIPRCLWWRFRPRTTGMYWTQKWIHQHQMEGNLNIAQHAITNFTSSGWVPITLQCVSEYLSDLQKNDAHNILINFQNLFDKIDLAKQNQIMSPGKNAYTLSQYFSEIFSVIPK